MFRRFRPQPPFEDDGDKPSRSRAKIGARIAARLGRNPMVERVASDRMAFFLRPGFASPEECALMRAMIDASARPSVLFAGSQSAGYRTSYSGHLDRDNALVRTLSDRIDAIMGAEANTGETLQGQRYHPGQEYKPHRDSFPVNGTYWPEMRDRGGQRCWTAMLYLSAVEEGGETEFPRAGFMVPPVEGTLALWNNLRPDGAPNPETLHAALPVRKGVKYVATRWYRERPWIAGDGMDRSANGE